MIFKLNTQGSAQQQVRLSYIHNCTYVAVELHVSWAVSSHLAKADPCNYNQISTIDQKFCALSIGSSTYGCLNRSTLATVVRIMNHAILHDDK